MKKEEGVAGRNQQTKRRMRQNRAYRTRKDAQRRKPPGDRQVQTGADDPDAGPEGQKPQYGWVAVEHRDADGNQTLPRNLLESTYPRRYEEVPPGTKLEAHVLAGYKPKALMMVERKIYEIQSLSIGGWRRRGLIGVEVDGWRGHEADWFNAMEGVKLEISDPGRPGPHNKKTQYRVADSSFDRKIVTVIDQAGTTTEHRLFEGTLSIAETWKSAWRRHGADVLNLGFKVLFAPLLVALGAGIALLWIDRPMSSDPDTPQSQPKQSQQPVQTEEGAAVVPTPTEFESPPKAAEAAQTQALPSADQSLAEGTAQRTRQDKPVEEAERVREP